MYVNLGAGNVLRKAKIIGIFDLDTATVTGSTKVFLRRAEHDKKLINCTDDLPKTFVVDEDNMVYVSQLSARSLKYRAEAKGFK